MKKKKILDLVQNWWVSWDVSGQGKEPLLKIKFKKRQRRGGGVWQGNSVCKSACHHA